jgi:hypothetical protein
VAATVARANAAELGACEFDGLVVTVTAHTRVAGFAVEASATAGPAAEGRSPPFPRRYETAPASVAAVPGMGVE